MMQSAASLILTIATSKFDVALFNFKKMKKSKMYSHAWQQHNHNQGFSQSVCASRWVAQRLQRHWHNPNAGVGRALVLMSTDDTNTLLEYFQDAVVMMMMMMMPIWTPHQQWITRVDDKCQEHRRQKSSSSSLTGRKCLSRATISDVARLKVSM